MAAAVATVVVAVVEDTLAAVVADFRVQLMLAVGFPAVCAAAQFRGAAMQAPVAMQEPADMQEPGADMPAA